MHFTAEQKARIDVLIEKRVVRERRALHEQHAEEIRRLAAVHAEQIATLQGALEESLPAGRKRRWRKS